MLNSIFVRGYDIDGTVKLLCKYLRAYENRGKFKGINKMCRNNGKRYFLTVHVIYMYI